MSYHRIQSIGKALFSTLLLPAELSSSSSGDTLHADALNTPLSYHSLCTANQISFRRSAQYILSTLVDGTTYYL